VSSLRKILLLKGGGGGAAKAPIDISGLDAELETLPYTLDAFISSESVDSPVTGISSTWVHA